MAHTAQIGVVGAELGQVQVGLGAQTAATKPGNNRPNPSTAIFTGKLGWVFAQLGQFELNAVQVNKTITPSSTSPPGHGTHQGKSRKGYRGKRHGGFGLDTHHTVQLII